MVALIGPGGLSPCMLSPGIAKTGSLGRPAREAAHQIGTPLSGLMGAIERCSREKTPNEAPTILPMLEKDVERIQEVVDRFSKIGAPPQLCAGTLQPPLQSVVAYFQARTPKISTFT